MPVPSTIDTLLQLACRKKHISGYQVSETSVTVFLGHDAAPLEFEAGRAEALLRAALPQVSALSSRAAS